MKIRHYGLEEFHADCKRIAEQLVSAEYHPDYWIALDRGGVIPAATIRREFQNLVGGHRAHLIIKHKNDRWEDSGLFTEKSRVEKILLIDDIVDFGTQYEKSIRAFEQMKSEAMSHNEIHATSSYGYITIPRTKHAALIWNVSNKCGVRADFYGQTIDKENNPHDNAWIKFWWEGD